MEFLQRAKVFRLKCSHQSKYLIADQDEETVKLHRDNSSTYARWSFEYVEGKTNVIRLKSCHSGKYLAVSEEQFLLGMTGKRCAQRPWLGSTVEWEPIKEGPYVKLKTHIGTFLRGNRGPPPWRNTVTHDVAGHWTASESMVLWIIDIVEIDHKQSTNEGDSNSTEKSKGNGPDCVPSSSSNVGDQKLLSSSSSLSTEDDGSSKNAASASLENCISFSNLKSMLENLDDVETEYIDGKETSETERILPSEVVKTVKRPLEELKGMEFRTIVSLGRYKELETEIELIVANAKTSCQERNLVGLANVQEQMKVMKFGHDSATQDLVEYATFADMKAELKAEVDKDLAKASVLEATLEKWFSEGVANSRAKKQVLLKELETTNSSIKAVEVLLRKIEKRRKRLEDMEAEEESWQLKKVKAERKLDEIEKQWIMVKNSITIENY